MTGFRLLPVLIILLFVCGIWVSNMKLSPGFTSEDSLICVGEATDSSSTESDDESGEVSGWTPPVIPACVKRLLRYADWSTDTICVANGKAYYLAHDVYYRTSVIYSEDSIIVANPVLLIDSFAPGCKEKFYVSVVGKTLVADFLDRKSIKKLASLSRVLPDFCRYRHDTIADFGQTVLYSFAVDFPKSGIKNANAIRKWLIRLIERSQSTDETIPTPNAWYIGYNKRDYDGWAYKGDINNNSQIGRFAVNHYFAIKKEEYGTNDDDYPATLFADLNLQAVVYKQEIDCDYLFKPECMKDVLHTLIEEAKKTLQYKEWEPNIMEYVSNKDENGNQAGGFTLPTPGLSENGVVFSFQPYAISCFAAGTFHFTIPYSRIRNCLTQNAKWCVGQN